MKKMIFLALLFQVPCFMLHISSAHARTDGYYIGGGYQQPIIISWKKQLGTTSRISFWPGFGAHLKVGYEFDKPDWLGLALPINWSMLRLNKTEWVQLLNADAQVIFHMREPEKKFDPYLATLVGFNFLTEGSIKNQSQSLGPDFGGAFGFNYTISEYALAGATHVNNLSLNVEFGAKLLLFMNDEDLASSTNTPFLQLPVKIGLQYSF